MSTGTQLIAELRLRVKNRSFDDDQALADLNSGLNRVVSSPYLNFPLLNTVGQVDTVIDDDSADLPDDFSGTLYLAKYDGNDLEVYDDWAQLHLDHGGETGALVAVAVDGDTLRYLPSQDAELPIDIYYYRKPVVITDTIGADCFNREQVFHGELAIIHYAAMLQWERIEIGIDGNKPNTDHHRKKFDEHISELSSQVRAGNRSPYAGRNRIHL